MYLSQSYRLQADLASNPIGKPLGNLIVFERGHNRGLAFLRNWEAGEQLFGFGRLLWG